MPLVDLKFLTVLPRVLQELQIGGTSTFGRFETLVRPAGRYRDVMLQRCGKPKALSGTLGESHLFYPSGGYKPMLSLTILVVSPNAFPPFLYP